MKKTVSCLLAVLLVASLFTGCAKQSGEPSGELVIYAAASMSEVLPRLTAKYQEKHPGVSPTFSFEPSDALKSRIAEGADCDVFISAAPRQMNELDIDADDKVNPDRLDFIDGETRFDLLENKVALVTAPGNPKNIQSFDDLVKGLRDGTVQLAIAGPESPVGQYTRNILEYYHLREDELVGSGLVSYEEDEKSVAAQVLAAEADCGIVFVTDAKSAGLEPADYASKSMCGQVVYPAAMLKNAKNSFAAKDFLKWLQTSDEAASILKQAGFTPVR